MQPTLIRNVQIELIVVVMRTGAIPGICVMAAENPCVPSLIETPCVSEKCAELCVSRLAGIDLRVRREHTGEKTIRIRIMKIQLEGRMIAGAGDAADKVVAGQCRGARPLIGCECMGRCETETDEQYKTGAQTHYFATAGLCLAHSIENLTTQLATD